jgi:hypothetical protein
MIKYHYLSALTYYIQVMAEFLLFSAAQSAEKRLKHDHHSPFRACESTKLDFVIRRKDSMSVPGGFSFRSMRNNDPPQHMGRNS